MMNEDFIKKAKELGLSDEEIQNFINNQQIAQKYGFDGEYSSLDVKIDKNVNINADLNKDCNCEDESCCNHHDHKCDCKDDCECKCHIN